MEIKIEKFRVLHEMRMKEIRDRNARDEYVWDEGLARGRAEGEAKGKAESVLQLLAKNGAVPEDLRKRIFDFKFFRRESLILNFLDKSKNIGYII